MAGPRKVKRLEAQEQKRKEAERRRKAEKKRYAFYSVGVLVVLLVGWLVYARVTREMPGMAVPDLGNEHIPSIDYPHIPYNSDPPTSGPHVTGLARWGIHDRPIPRELQVHNLEDGGVLVQYNCQDCDQLIANLAKIVRKYERAILAPYPGMDATIALTAWGRIDKFNDFDERRVVRFIEAYMGIDHHAP